jgi:formylglycine-generating enzyme required for sulfatase activity/predicted Ser/Thr protein kinase
MTPRLPTFGRYTALEVLGKGGMGTVYLARHPELGYELAIKSLSGGAARTDDQRRRFQREIRALCKLSHQNVVTIVEAGEEGGVPWFAMRRVEGQTLEERLHSRGPLTAEEAVALGVQLCEGLGVAHAQGILHRDLKPQNVLCATQGHYVVTDFGLAKELTVESTIRLSQSGMLQGTPGYWAPEQATGHGSQATTRTDVYGVGGVLYAALTGSAPIVRPSLIEYLTATLEQPPEPLSPRARVPEWLERIVLRCLAKAPQDRYDSLAELREALLSGREQSGGGGRAALSALVGALALLVLVGLMAGRGSSDPSAAPPAPDPQPDLSPRRTPSLPPPPALDAPAWYLELPAGKRPQRPLPAGIRICDAPGEYLNLKDGSVLVWASAGSFVMGDGGRKKDEGPAHRVTFSRGFFVGKHEVSWGQFHAYRKAVKRPLRQSVIAYRRTKHHVGEDHPVFRVSWGSARKYCAWAGLRLPSEAEWEYAARGSDGREYPWGKEQPSALLLNLAGAELGDHPGGEPWSDARRLTAPITEFPAGASPFGCLNMAGNVWEWVEDDYVASYVGAPTDGSPRRGSSFSPRVCRGGSWYNGANMCRAATRKERKATTSMGTLGFRVARSHP